MTAKRIWQFYVKVRKLWMAAAFKTNSLDLHLLTAASLRLPKDRRQVKDVKPTSILK